MFIHTLVTLSAYFEAKVSGVENNRENCIHKKRQDFEVHKLYFYKQGSTAGTKRLTIKLILMQNTLQIFLVIQLLKLSHSWSILIRKSKS